MIVSGFALRGNKYCREWGENSLRRSLIFSATKPATRWMRASCSAIWVRPSPRTTRASNPIYPACRIATTSIRICQV